MAQAATTSNRSPEVPRSGQSRMNGDLCETPARISNVEIQTSLESHRPMPQAFYGVIAGDGEDGEKEVVFILLKNL